MSASTRHRPLRTVVLYSGGHLGSAATVNTLARMEEFELVGFVRADPVSISRVGRLVGKLRKIGLLFAWLLIWQRIVMEIGFMIGRLLPLRRRYTMVRSLADEAGVPLLRCHDINDPAVRQWIEACQPDLIVSACFSQILKSEVIAVPSMGCLNVHPGYLPTYRGAMAYFWPLHRGDRHAGVSVHWIDEGIDTGPLLERRRLRVRRHATQQKMLVKSAVAGAYLLRRVARQLMAGQTPKPISIEPAAGGYFHFPAAADISGYMARYRFFRMRDLLRMLLKPATR